MADPIRILLLEDVELDAELAARELRSGGLNFTMTRVDDRESFLSQLRENTPDLILSDYHLPGFDGLEALKVAREQFPDIPFIFFSGAIGEERAIETLTSGATDYVLKDRMTRLLPAVRRAMDEAEGRKERRRLEREVAEISVREQSRIGRDLHDVVGQNLTATMFMMKTLEKRLQMEKRPEAEQAARISQQVKETIQQVRRLVRGLCPVELGGEGLKYALQGLCSNVRELFSIDCEFKSEGDPVLSDSRVATEMYYIAQESLNNALKHSKATALRVNLARRDDELVMTISDNGCGLPEESTRPKGMGLNVMAYRARQIGAHLDITSNPGSGVTITCRIVAKDG